LIAFKKRRQQRPDIKISSVHFNVSHLQHFGQDPQELSIESSLAIKILPL
jgi:hypothetical protein